MFCIRLAGLTVGIKNRYAYLKDVCADYICPDGKVDFTVSASDEDLAHELEASEKLGMSPPPQYLESVCIYRNICLRLPEYGAFLLHAAVVECDGVAYAFSAPSGTGKSTHTRLWLEHFGSGARIINGDKPILRFVDGTLFAFGTPWCGKEHYQVNAAAPLHALCFLERGEKNEIRSLPLDEAVMRTFSQVLLPSDESGIDLLFPLLEKALSSLSLYALRCTVSEEAVIVAHNAMSKGTNKS